MWVGPPPIPDLGVGTTPVQGQAPGGEGVAFRVPSLGFVWAHRAVRGAVVFRQESQGRAVAIWTQPLPPPPPRAKAVLLACTWRPNKTAGSQQEVGRGWEGTL